MIGDLHRGVVMFLPPGDVDDVGIADDFAVELAQQVLHQNADGKGQTLDRAHSSRNQGLDIVIGQGLTRNTQLLGEITFVHGICPRSSRYMWVIMASAKAEHFTSVAPSICRARS